MLSKLLKYDIKSLLKTLTPLYIIMIMLAVLNRICSLIVDKLPIVKIPAGFIMAFYVIMLIGIPIATFVITIIKFYTNLAKDEGYLMHTLPVTKSNLVLSKLFSNMIMMLSSLLVIALAFLIGTYDNSAAKIINDIFNEIAKSGKESVIIVTTIEIVLGLIMQQLLIYASIALGQKHNTNKIAFSFVYGIVLYNVNQIISAIIIFLPMLFNSKLKEYIKSDNIPNDGFNYIMITSIILTLVLIGTYFFTTTKVMDKKLNLE